MIPLAFLRENARWLAAGGAMTFLSSFGQTYFISIFAGEIRDTFALSHGAWGGIYTLGTLASAATMMLVGPLADRFRVRLLAPLVLVGLSLACIAMASLAPALVALLPLVVYALRFCGQGMLTQLPAVAVGRWFSAARGRAISIVFLGVAAGEAVLPVTFVTLAGLLGWRSAWIVAAAVPLVAAPLLFRALGRERRPQSFAAEEGTAGLDGRHWGRRQALSHWLFWATFPGFLAQPIFGTALFFHQVHLVETKGWALAAFVSLMPLFVGAQIAGLVGAGAAIDRFGSARVVPLMLLPAAAGYVLLSSTALLPLAAAALVLVGLTQGILSAANGAWWPEIYGTRHLGAIRAMATALMVFATALGPGVTGALIDAGVAFDTQLVAMAAWCVAASALFAVAAARAVRALPARA